MVDCPKSFQTDRLRLNIISDSHTQDVFDTLNFKETAEMISFLTWPMTFEQAQDWVKKSELGMRNKNELLYIAYTKDKNKPVGCICLLIEEDPRKCEVGYWVANPWQGKKIGTEMLRSIIDLAFEKFKLEKIIAKVAIHNPSSMRVVQKTGFTPIGRELKKTAKGTQLEMIVFEIKCETSQIRAPGF